MLAPHRLQSFGITVELLLTAGHVDERHQSEHHPLIAGRQVVQHLLGFLALQFHIIGDGGRPVVGGVLFTLPVGNVRFHPQQGVLHLAGGLVGGHRQDVDRQHHAAVEIAEFGDKAVLDVARVVLQIEHSPKAPIDLEVVGGELHAVGAEPILEAVAAFGVLAQVEVERGRLTGLEEIPQQAEAVWRGQLRRHRAELGEMRDQVSADAGEVGAGLIDVPLDDADGQIPLPHHTVTGAGDLGAQHLVEFFAVVVEGVAVQGQQHRPLEILLVDAAVVDGDLGRRAGVQGVEQGAVAVRPDAADGDGVLDRARDLELHALLALGGCQRFGQGRASGVLVISFFFIRFLRFRLVLSDLKSSVLSMWFLARRSVLRLQPSAMAGSMIW